HSYSSAELTQTQVQQNQAIKQSSSRQVNGQDVNDIYIISGTKTDTQTITGTNNGTITNSATIQVSGNNNKAVDFQTGSSTSTFLNQGTLIGGNNAASVNLGTNNQNGVTIETFNNEGIIGNGSSKFGITVWGNTNNKSTIESFNNSGTISSNAGEVIYFTNTNIQTFNNSGTIKSNSGHGINITGGVSIDTLKNTGTIQSGNQEGIDGIRIKGSNVTINQIDNSGVIKSEDEAIGIKDWAWNNRLKVDTIKNSGTLKGTIIGIVGLNADIDLIQNTGTIITGKYNVTDGGSAAIQLHSSSVGTIINSGYIKSASTYGIQLITANSSNTLKTLINSGTIEGKMDGLFIGQGTKTDYIENTGVIKGGNAGINVD
ncbi:hypothetical protein KJK76_001883, partial [Campylobacter jejuni]|nr:hypothetical protein [Campylobacter jejuni]